MAGSQHRQLHSSQAEAAHTLNRHISVSAGPGSGKTSVLIERYVHILKTSDISIDQIVAITFTNRAASEMRERLRRELDSLIEKAALDEQRKWAQHKRRLDGAIITTIHGFCAGLLREFPIEAGLDPEFTLLDEHQTVMLEEAIVQQMVTEWITIGDQAVSALAAGIGRLKLASTLAAIYRSMRNQGLNPEQLAARTRENHSTTVEYEQALEELNSAMTSLVTKTGLKGVAEEKRKAIASEWPALKAMLNRGPGALEIADFCRGIEEFRRNRPSARDPLKQIIQRLDELIWENDLAGKVPRIWLDFQAREYSIRLAEMAGSLERRLKEEKRSIPALDFDDLQIEALAMLDRHPELIKKLTARYRFFLVDEFQDTNSLQRDLMERLVLNQPGTNLFIVGDRKQSIYGFRGADVQVFQDMAVALEGKGGSSKPLHFNFRSQAPLIHSFNHIFRQIFARPLHMTEDELEELGFVEHEASVSQRPECDGSELVELLIDSVPDVRHDPDEFGGGPRERDARQVALRCRTLVAESGLGGEDGRAQRGFRYSDIAILFRAMTQASLYETALRRARVPYQTIQGRGFYDRQEVTDLIQLLRFLDNRTDDLALAAVLRSPLCGLSDNVLLAIGAEKLLKAGSIPEKRRRRTRTLWSCLLRHAQNDLIPEAERSFVQRAIELLTELVRVRHGIAVSMLLRIAMERAEYRTVIAASFEGAQRLANVEKLIQLAERFERSGANNIRDFVRFVGDFERFSGREGEGRVDESQDAVRLMTIHQAKGLQFPVVIIPELHRKPQEKTDWFILDRARGLTVKIPDGRSSLAAGITMERLRERARWRDRFENARLLYVGATRAEDRLILTGSAPDLAKLDDPDGDDTWLAWICRSLNLRQESFKSGFIPIGDGGGIKLEINLADQPADRWAGLPTPYRRATTVTPPIDVSRPPEASFPLLKNIGGDSRLRSLSVTQLTNFTRCPRQYYFNRVLHAPERGDLAAWEQPEAPEPPANLTASLKGAAIHMFCERFVEGMEPDVCLRSSLDYILRTRMADRGEGIAIVHRDAAIKELRPLVENYLASGVRRRIESARVHGFPDYDSRGREQQERHARGPVTTNGAAFSEQSFSLRHDGRLIRGTIDKLLVVGDERLELRAEIIDFKTNRFNFSKREGSESPTGAKASGSSGVSGPQAKEQLLSNAVESAALGVRMQMQIYALAVRELLPSVTEVKATLHFVHPNIEYSLDQGLLDPVACRHALDATLTGIDAASRSGEYSPLTGTHCRTCGFLNICHAGRRALVELEDDRGLSY